jgi:rhodanese-related sulfurtransferase
MMFTMPRLPQLLLSFLLSAWLLIGLPASAAGAAAIPVSPVEDSPAIAGAIEDYLSSMPNDYYAIRSVPALKRFLESPDSLLIDVRTVSEYKSGHIPGAVNIPLEVLGSHVAEFPVEQPVVLYCSTGYRSAMGVMALQLEGRHEAMGFPPSFAGWKAAGEPVVAMASIQD